MFGVGDLVVCVDDGPKAGPIAAIVPINHLIRRGRVYRIDFIGKSWLGKPLIGLEGVTLPPPMMGFAPYRFRKVQPADAGFQALVQRLKPKQDTRELEPVD